MFFRGFFASGLVLAVFLSLTEGAGFADGTGPLDLSQSIEIAIKQSLQLGSAREEVKGAEAMRKEAFAGFLPTLSTSYSYTRLNEAPGFTFPGAVFTLPAPLGSGTIPASTFKTGTENNYNWNVELRQPLYAGGGIAAGYEASRAGVEIARQSEKQTILNVILDTSIAYYNILKAQRVLDVAAQSLRRLEAHRDTAQAFYDTGIIPRNDLLRAEVELANGRQALLRAENNLEIAQSGFNTLLRRKIDSPVAIKDEMHAEIGISPLSDCIADALKNRPEIRAYEIRVRQAGSLVNQARSGYYPSLSVVGDYARYGDTPGVAGSPYRDQESWYVLAIANWNVWEWGKTKNRVDAGKSREKQAEHLLAGLREQIVLEVKNSYLRFGEARKQLPAAIKTIEQAEENFRISSERYKEQVGTATDVIDAQTLLTVAASDYQNYLCDLNIAKARLDRATGVSAAAVLE